MRRNFFQHPRALVESRRIGEGTRIWAFAHVMPDVVIGRDCNVGEACFLETSVVIGSGVTIKNGCLIWSGVEIQDGAFIGPGVVFTNDLWPRSPRLPEAAPRYRDSAWLERTVVEVGASIGARAVIRAGLRIGAYATVAMGAVVTRSVPPQALVVGVPARQSGWVCRCGLKLALRGRAARCASCGRRYARTGDQLQMKASG